ncbi:zinc finger, CCHC-type containing protein [Tanacetum coccineum]
MLIPRTSSKDPNQHLKDFLKLVDSLDLYVANRERTRLCLFQFSLRDQASNWLERLLAGSISTWEDLTTRFLAQFFPPGRTTKLRNDILMFQQHQGESLLEAWTHFKELLQKVPHHGIDLWHQGIKSHLKLLLLKFCLNHPWRRTNRIPISKRVHFVNSIIILNKEDEAKESTKSSATDYKDHEMTVESKEEFEEETEEKTKEEEEDNPKHFDVFPTIKELGYHEWLLKNPRPPWVKAKIRTGN